MAEMEHVVKRETRHRAALNTETYLTDEEVKQLKFKCPVCGEGVNLSTFGEHLNEEMMRNLEMNWPFTLFAFNENLNVLSFCTEMKICQ